MADPAIVACPAEAWTLVAASVTTGIVHVMKDSPKAYLQTYRAAGGGAPTQRSEGVKFSGSIPISASALIDVYIWADGEAGSVRVDV